MRGVLMLLISAAPAVAQMLELDYARLPHSTAYSEKGHAVAIDPAGNTLVAGSLTRFTGFEVSSLDAFIIKYESTTGSGWWSYNFGAGGDDEALSVAIDPEGAIYATGYFSGTVDFDNSDDTTTLVSGQAPAPFILKIDADGRFVWARGFVPVVAPAIGQRIALDPSGNIYVSGTFSNTLDVDPSPSNAFTLTSTGGEDAFLVKLDPFGILLWARSFGGTGTDKPTALAVDRTGTVLLTGTYADDANLDSYGLDWPITHAGGTDFFIVSLDTEGRINWGHGVGGVGDDAAYAVAVDSARKVHVAGVIRETVDLVPGQGESFHTAELSDLFLLSLDAAGAFSGAMTMSSHEGEEAATALVADASDNLYMGGIFNRSLSFSGSDVVLAATPGKTDVFLAKFVPVPPPGLWDTPWAYRLGADVAQTLSGLAVTGGGLLALAGWFEGTIDADPTSAESLLTSGAEDAFHFVYRQRDPGLFEDSRLEAAVRETLGIFEGPISLDALAQLTELEAPGRDIRSLAGLESATNLTYANLSYNSIQSLDPLLHGALAPGARLDLFGNPLDLSTVCTTIPQLQSEGVIIGFEGTCDTAGPARPARIFGFVDSGGVPLTCASVAILRGEGMIGAAVVDDAGYYEINNLAQGVEYTLRFEAPSFVPAVVVRTPMAREQEVSIELVPDAAPVQISGFVRELAVKDHEPWPVPVARVTASLNGVVLGRTLTCASGFFSFSGLDLLKQAEITLSFSALGYVDTSVAVLLKDAFVDVSMEKINLPGSVIGIVVDPELVPADAAQVVVQQTPAGFSAVRTTADDGAYSVSNVPDGTYEVRAVVTGVGSGLNNGEVQQSLTTIDVELLTDLREDCVPPSPPTGVTASDGTNSDAVIVTWNSLGAGIEYRVLRANNTNLAGAVPVSDWITDTTFSDTAAGAPTSSSSGCGGPTVTFTTHHYWVTARAGVDCESPPAGGDGGFRGEAGKQVAALSDMSTLLLAIVGLLAIGGRNSRCRRA